MNFKIATILVAMFFGPQCLAHSKEFSESGIEWEGEDGDLSYVEPLAESANWVKLIKEFGGKVVPYSRYPQSVDGFKNFMRDSGVTEYDPVEIITPPSPEVANKCGITHLLPSRARWPQGAALALWGQAITTVAQEKPVILNWYRSRCYNKAVGGARASDHISARSTDLDFHSPESRRRAQKWLCAYWNTRLNMQIGLGDSVIHLGTQSPRGKRNWFYDTYQDPDRGKTCFD